MEEVYHSHERAATEGVARYRLLLRRSRARLAELVARGAPAEDLDLVRAVVRRLERMILELTVAGAA